MENFMDEFKAWANSKDSVNCIIMNNGAIIAELNGKLIMTYGLNEKGYPTSMMIYSKIGDCFADIGQHYINDLYKGENHWTVFVDGFQTYIFK